MAATHQPAPGTVLVYATSWCPFCSRLRQDLEAAGVDFDVVDIEADEPAAQFVESVNRGNRVVPTVLFPNGDTLTNPDPEEVRARLDA